MSDPIDTLRPSDTTTPVEQTFKVEQQHTRSGWPLSVKVRRVLWGPFKLLFLRGTGRWLSPVRIAALRLFGAQIETPNLVMDGVLVWHPWSLTLKRFACLGRGVEVYNYAHITIGEQATISQGTYLCSASHDFEDPTMPLIYHPITIGAQSWVSANCFVGPGVTIGEGAVVGACSVVVKDVPAWVVVAGNPARVIKARRLVPASQRDSREGADAAPKPPK
ncbi:MAG TPA: putative colanic acid biosynthesis acetyltransferase [Steroidobacteraceae bacterium]|nr:putative colanic acid biosynthesis acetyltransferase [Steroidobacteraceae bacterium]